MKVYIGPYPGKKSKKTEQTIRVRIDKYDTWSFDHTLAHIILPGLIQLKETKHGSPLVDDEDVPVGIRSVDAPPKENEWDVDEYVHVRWNYVMDEMIWAFSQYNTDWEDQYWSGESDRYFEELDEFDIDGEKLYEWKIGPNHTLRLDREGYEAHHKRIQNGLRLFGKYYSGLWD